MARGALVLALLALTAVCAYAAIPVVNQDGGKPRLAAQDHTVGKATTQALIQMGVAAPNPCMTGTPACQPLPSPCTIGATGCAQPQIASTCNPCHPAVGGVNVKAPRQLYHRPEVVIVMDEPTEDPTPMPSSDPSRYPTPIPSAQPTPIPSPIPSPFPSHVPSPSPTDLPSKEPTPIPSPHPSFDPTPIPSPIPSRHPSRSPTRYPTRNPTQVPTTYTWKKDGYTFTRENIFGVDERTDSLMACRRAGKWPVCDIAKVADGHCLYPHGNYRLSRPTDASRKGLPQRLLAGGYYYNGKANKVWVQKNTGRTNRWSKLSDRGSFTYCTSMKFKMNGFVAERIPVEGIMNSTNIETACIRQGMRPLIDMNRYDPGSGKVAKIATGNWHMSHPSQSRKHGLASHLTRGVFFYAADAHKGKSLVSTGGGHRWSSNSDKNKDTYCVKK